MSDETGKGAPTAASQSDDDMREKRLQRNLKILVIGLGVAILAGLGALAVRMTELANRGPSAAPVTATLSAGGREIALELPRGAKIVSISVSEKRLAVHHDGPAGPAIAIIDLETGARLADVRPLEALPRN